MPDCLKKYIFMKYFLGLMGKTGRFNIIVRHFVNTAVFYTRGERKKSLMHQRCSRAFSLVLDLIL